MVREGPENCHGEFMVPDAKGLVAQGRADSQGSRLCDFQGLRLLAGGSSSLCTEYSCQCIPSTLIYVRAKFDLLFSS